MTLQAIKWNPKGKLEILDQTQLPNVTLYVDIPNIEAGWEAIKTMKVNLRMFFSDYFAMFIGINYLILI